MTLHKQKRGICGNHLKTVTLITYSDDLTPHMSDLQQYDESSVTVLKGLEPVKQRPGMYTRTDNPTHICQEVIDNAADEALGGYADTISVTIHSDGSMSISDNGRGIPVGLATPVLPYPCLFWRKCQFQSAAR